MENEKFDPKKFLGAKVISPLEQEKLVGGMATPGDFVETVNVVVTIVTIKVIAP